MRFSTFLKSTQAGLSAALLTYGSAIALVYFAARNAGATPEQTASWLICTGLAMGLSSIALSLHYRIPLVTTWSVATAARW